MILAVVVNGRHQRNHLLQGFVYLSAYHNWGAILKNVDMTNYEGRPKFPGNDLVCKKLLAKTTLDDQLELSVR